MDACAQRDMFDNILANVRERKNEGHAPDLVFVTGDIANRGRKEEYAEFLDDFFGPLKEVLGRGGDPRIFIVPGDHDVSAADVTALPEEHPGPSDVTEEEHAPQSRALPRLEKFRGAGRSVVPDIWLDGARGNFVEQVEIAGRRLGILGINTTWLSHREDDRRLPAPARPFLEQGLKRLGGCDLRVVLGHFPIEMWAHEQVARVRALMAGYGVVYLHGHLHEHEVRVERGSGRTFLSIQAGAAFRSWESGRWASRVLWCELGLDSGQIRGQPLQWSEGDPEWRIARDALPASHTDGEADWWAIDLPGLQVTSEPALPG